MFCSFHSSVCEDSVLRCDTVSVGNQILIFQGHCVVLEFQDLMTQWHGVVSQKNRSLNRLFLGYIAQVIYQDEACWPLKITEASYVPAVILLRYILCQDLHFGLTEFHSQPLISWQPIPCNLRLWNNFYFPNWWSVWENHQNLKLFILFLYWKIFYWIWLLFISTCTVAATGICCIEFDRLYTEIPE